GFHGGGYQLFAGFKFRLGKFHDQNGVLGRQTNGGQQTDLEVHVVAQLTQYRRQQGTQHAEWHHHHHGEGDRPTFIQRRQTEEHHQQRNRQQEGGLRAGHTFLERHAGPLQTHPG